MAQTIVTLQAGTDQFCVIGLVPAKAKYTWTKAFLRMTIPPALYGVAPSAAVLSLYTFASGANAPTVEMQATFGNWDGSSTYATLNGLDLTNYDTLESKAVAAAGNWTTWNVLGTNHANSVGVLRACVSSEVDITFVLPYAGTPTERTEDLGIGTTDTAANYRKFDFPGFAGDGTHLPFLTITHPDPPAGGLKPVTLFGPRLIL